jgi:hypothetical protein
MQLDDPTDEDELEAVVCSGTFASVRRLSSLFFHAWWGR